MLPILSGGNIHAYYAYARRSGIGTSLVPLNAAGNAGLSDLAMIAMSGPTLHPLGPVMPQSGPGFGPPNQSGPFV
jgi:hypothetical protein